MGLIDYLRLFRAHTAPATLLSVMLVYYVGGGSIFSYLGVVIGLYALFIHWLSFGHNSLMDYKTGYDVRDANKQHHPLRSGKITVAQADRLIHWGLILFAMIGTIISFYGANPAYSITGLLLFYAAGHAYNDGLSKTSILSSIPITLSFSGLWLWAYFLSAVDFTPLSKLVLVYLALTLFYQIAWEGELKEIEADEANLLKSLGAKVDKGIFYPGFAGVIGLSKTASMAVLLVISTKATVLIGLALMFVLLVYLTVSRVWIRDKELTKMAVMEIISLYVLILAVMPVLEGATLMVFGIAYFISLNRFLWGTYLKPRV